MDGSLFFILMIMDTEMKHEDMMHGHNGPHMHEGHHRLWQNNWKSPVSLGIFILAVAIALFIFPIAIQSFIGISQELHPAASQGMSQQELQQLMQSQGSQSAPSGTTGQ